MTAEEIARGAYNPEGDEIQQRCYRHLVEQIKSAIRAAEIEARNAALEKAAIRGRRSQLGDPEVPGLVDVAILALKS